MKRRYSLDDYISLIDKVNNKIPNVCIGVDVIVGFPGETDNDFNKTYELLKEINISYLHIFTYSERKNTESEQLFPKVDISTKTVRREKLKKLSMLKYQEVIHKNINRELNILFEKYSDGVVSGWAENYIKVNVKSHKDCTNQIKTIKLMNNQEINGVFV